MRRSGLRPDPSRLRLFRTTAFKLSATYLAVFTIFAGFLIGYIATNTTQLLTNQMGEAVDAEVNALAEQYRIGGIRRLAGAVEKRAMRPGSSLYLVTSFTGDILAGNVAAVPPEVITRPDPALRHIPYRRLDDSHPAVDHVALVRVFALPGGFRILVGRDIGERERFAAIIRRALVLTLALMVALGLASWLFVARRVLNRIDSVVQTSRRIMAGDLAGRLEVTGTHDEFDRLAESLNAMLGRIESLMVGLKEVSDNIAHDLKTPLTRLRNRAEAALHGSRGEAECRDVLQAIIEDADQLIRTFDALLMIARAEAGSSGVPFGQVDAAGIARDVAELYEPLAEEAGASLDVTDAGPAPLLANRELLSQALANLIDNAIKYGGGARIDLAVARENGNVVISVADRGPGIAPQDRARVTERFVRLEASRSRPGAGLGLSLVAAVARLHGGELRLTDNAPGLRAELVLPADRESEDEPAAAA